MLLTKSRFFIVFRSLTLTRCYSNGTRTLLVPRPLTSVKVTRTLRQRTNESNKGQESEKTSNDDKEEKQEEEKERKTSSMPPLDENMKRRFRIYILGMTAVSFGVTLYLMTRLVLKQAEANPEVTPQAIAEPGIAIDDFLHNYLEKGEVRKVVFLPHEKKAIAVLHDGAVIGGRMSKDNVVTVATDLSAAQFWAEVRKVEDELGIPLSQGVALQLQQTIDVWRVLKLTIGVFIIVFLFSQYGRLIANRVAAKKAPPKQ